MPGFYRIQNNVPMPVHPDKRGTFIYAKDIMEFEQSSLSVCRRILPKVRKEYGIPPYHPVLLLFYLEYKGIYEEAIIRRYFPNAVNEYA